MTVRNSGAHAVAAFVESAWWWRGARGGHRRDLCRGSPSAPTACVRTAPRAAAAGRGRGRALRGGGRVTMATEGDNDRGAGKRRVRRRAPKEKDSDTFSLTELGFLEVGVITGAHGVRGAAKVRSLTDFARERLAEKGASRFLRLPGRLYPRPVTIKNGSKASQADVWIVHLDGMESPEEVNAIRGARLCVREEDRPRMGRGEFHVRDLIGLKVLMVGSAEEVGVVHDVHTYDELSRHITNAAKVGQDLLEVRIPRQLSASTPPEERVARGAPAEGHGAKPARQKRAQSRRRRKSSSAAQVAAAAADAAAAAGDDDELVLIPFVHQLVPHVDLAARHVLIDPPVGLFDIARVNQLHKRRPPPRGLLMPAKDEPQPRPPSLRAPPPSAPPLA